MTLLVAAVEDGSAWMLADTAVTDPTGDVRAREQTPKIETIGDHSVAGFAGDVHFGQRTIRGLSKITPGEAACAFLLGEHKKYRGTSFAYAYFDGSVPRLYRIDGGECQETLTLHIGDHAAFESFQSIRHDEEIDAAPNARHTLKLATYLPEQIPAGLRPALSALISHMAATSDRSVGGWITPFQLTKSGARLTPYSYVVSDPIADKLKLGEVIPFGTPSGGGFSFSLTELSDRLGMVAYWLQAPGGLILVRSRDWYEQTRLLGAPDEFKARAEASLSRQVELWFGGKPITSPERINIITDEEGRVRQAVVQQGHTIETTMMGHEGKPFSVTTQITMQQPDNVSPLAVMVSEDCKTATITLDQHQLDVDAATLEIIIRQLGRARSKMGDYPDLVKGSGVTIEAPIDPKWRTLTPPHPTVPGPLLNFLHPNFGWIGFVLPDHEAEALAKWLSDNVATRRKVS